MIDSVVELSIVRGSGPHPPDVERRNVRLENASNITLGRASSCDVVLVADSIGRRHAQLIDRDGRLWVSDMGSTNGTSVRGVHIRDCAIEVGDSFLVGEDQDVTVTLYQPIIDRDFETTESTFLSAIHQEPDDEDVREVYCDYLEEKNQTLRALFLRTELECRRTFDPQTRESVRDRLYTLSARLRSAARWRMLVARPHIEGCALPAPPGCTTRWGHLPMSERERTGAETLAAAPPPNAAASRQVPFSFLRECATCSRLVHYRDAYEESLYSRWRSVGLDGQPELIAVDHVVTRGA